MEKGSITVGGYIYLACISVFVILFSPYQWFFDTEPVETRIFPTVEHIFRKLRQGITHIHKRDSRDFYQPLQKEAREFRLLRILPGRSENVACELIHAFLDDPSLEYAALSYTWGHPLRNHQIWIDNRPHLVTRNLAQAMQQLRGDSPRLIWIDALCIDQSSLKERSEQVRLMRDIYSRAKKGVIIWLSDDARYQEAIKFLHEAETHEDPDLWVSSTVGNELYRTAWNQLSEFLCKGYWERVWIIQEVACASSISVFCGKHELKWSILVSADSTFGPQGQLTKADLSDWVLYAGSKRHNNAFVGAVLETMSQIIDGKSLIRGPYLFSKPQTGPKFLEVTRVSRGDIQKTMTLFDLLCIHIGAKASNPRDKIFALVGLAKDCQENEFDIDYSLSEIEVSRSLMNFIMNETKSLDFLCFPAAGKPLWTRNHDINGGHANETRAIWRVMGSGLVQDTADLLPKYGAAGCTSAQACLVPRRELHYRCFGNMESVYKILPTVRNTLVVKGCCVDEIAAYLFELTDSPTPVFIPWIAGLMKIPGIRHHRYPLIFLSYILLVFAKFLAGLYLLIAALFLLQYPPVLLDFLWHSSPGRTYRPLNSLHLPPIDPDFPPYPTKSSDWLQEPWMINSAEQIKRGIYFILHTSDAARPVSEHHDSSQHEKEKRVESYWRALVCNRTPEGAVAPDSWSNLFHVILHGPSFVPDDFLPPSSSTASGQPKLSDVQRAQLYVRPFFTAMQAHYRRVFITKKGRIGTATTSARPGDLLCVFWGCSYIVVVKRENGRRGNGAPAGVGRDASAVITSVMRSGAYLDGYMDGRAVQETHNGMLHELEFRLY